VDATVKALAEEDPALYEQLLAMRPATTHAGGIRFTDPAIHDPRAAAVLLHRLQTENLDPETRAALVEALPRTGGDYGEAAVALLGQEKDADVRRALVGTMKRAEPERAVEGVRLGLSDQDSRVRAEAATMAGWISEGADLEPQLVSALEEKDPGIRAAASRSLGVLKVASAFDSVVPLLADDSAEVRLQALHALERIDAGQAARLDRLQALASDPDPRVARAAKKLAEGR
jgi:HEAT repeat protein